MAEIYTSLGMVEESLLIKTEGEVNNDNEHTTWQEWRTVGNELVKREAQVRLKTIPVFGVGEVGSIA